MCVNKSFAVTIAMAAGWSNEETKTLVSIWGEANVQNQLDGVVRNKVVYEKIAVEMGKLGFERNWQQCRTKIKNLTHKYRKVSMVCFMLASL